MLKTVPATEQVYTYDLSPLPSFFFASPHCMQYLSSSTRNEIRAPLQWKHRALTTGSPATTIIFLIIIIITLTWASLVAQTVKNLPAMQETWVRSLGGEDPLEKEMATHSCILASEIPWTEEPGGLQSMGSQKTQNNLATEQHHLHLSRLPSLPFNNNYFLCFKCASPSHLQTFYVAPSLSGTLLLRLCPRFSPQSSMDTPTHLHLDNSFRSHFLMSLPPENLYMPPHTSARAPPLGPRAF